MRTLWLVRHAKAEKGDGIIKDIDRPLSKRGYRESYTLSAEIRPMLTGKKLLITSPAIRTMTTAAIFADEFEFPRQAIMIEKNLYLSGQLEYLETLQFIENSFDTVILFGHNPVISEMVSLLSGMDYADLPTCTAAAFEMAIDDWKNFQLGKSKLKGLFSPKS